MFTGIISNTTAIKRSRLLAEGLEITFARPKDWNDIKLGDSIATNGVCLTIAALRANEYDCLLIPETLSKSSFGHQLPATVNLERSLRANDRLDGHFVQGHVDGVGIVTKIDKSDGWRLFINFPSANNGLIVQKGSITIDGVALTIVSVKGNNLSVALIPHTLAVTTLKDLQVGSEVNIEIDVLGKYVANILKQK
ncbi:MAG TPA: riboflavin synthase [Candidatus Saccharimonadales bacterium]